jgi:hypothetical protein
MKKIIIFGAFSVALTGALILFANLKYKNTVSAVPPIPPPPEVSLTNPPAVNPITPTPPPPSPSPTSSGSPAPAPATIPKPLPAPLPKPIPTPSSSATVLFSENFEDTNFDKRGWYDLSAKATLSSDHATVGSTKSVEVHFTKGATNPTPNPGGRHLFTGSDSVYLSYYVKYSTNWVGSGKSYHPHEFHFLTNEDGEYVGPAWTYLTTYIEQNYQNGGYAMLGIQDGKNIDTTKIKQDLTNVTENRAVAGCNGANDQDCYKSGTYYYNGEMWKSAVPVFTNAPDASNKNSWHKVEVYFKLNTIVGGKGQADGIAKYTIDGKTVIDEKNIIFRTGAHPNMKFNQFLFAPYIGDGSPIDQNMWVDDLVVATDKP